MHRVNQMMAMHWVTRQSPVTSWWRSEPAGGDQREVSSFWQIVRRDGYDGWRKFLSSADPVLRIGYFATCFQGQIGFARAGDGGEGHAASATRALGGPDASILATLRYID